ncbi:hypothetical protein N9W34_03010 [Rickettsiales bacterium]|nr:hypothetical protein [Rickettsiales bacterium]
MPTERSASKDISSSNSREDSDIELSALENEGGKEDAIESTISGDSEEYKGESITRIALESAVPLLGLASVYANFLPYFNSLPAQIARGAAILALVNLYTSINSKKREEKYELIEELEKLNNEELEELIDIDISDESPETEISEEEVEEKEQSESICFKNERLRELFGWLRLNGGAGGLFLAVLKANPAYVLATAGIATTSVIAEERYKVKDLKAELERLLKNPGLIEEINKFQGMTEESREEILRKIHQNTENESQRYPNIKKFLLGLASSSFIDTSNIPVAAASIIGVVIADVKQTAQEKELLSKTIDMINLLNKSSQNEGRVSQEDQEKLEEFFNNLMSDKTEDEDHQKDQSWSEWAKSWGQWAKDSVISLKDLRTLRDTLVSTRLVIGPLVSALAAYGTANNALGNENNSETSTALSQAFGMVVLTIYFIADAAITQHLNRQENKSIAEQIEKQQQNNAKGRAMTV